MWEIYLIEQADNVKTILFILSIFTILYVIIVALFHIVDEMKPPKH